MRVKNKNNNSNAGEPALPSPIALPRGRWWSRGNPVPSVPRWPSLVPLVHCVFGGPQKLWPQQPRPPLGGAGRGGPPSLPRRNAGFPPVCLFYSKKKSTQAVSTSPHLLNLVRVRLKAHQHYPMLPIPQFPVIYGRAPRPALADTAATSVPLTPRGNGAQTQRVRGLCHTQDGAESPS